MRTVVTAGMKGVANMASPKISFYMTVRNGERFIRQALESIKAQDIDCWEAVIVDDGSSDATVRLLESFAGEDPRFRVEFTEGVGRGRALNQAVSLCRAEILTNLDADDLAHPQRARVLLEMMGKHPKFAVLTGRSQVIFNDGKYEWPVLRDVDGSLGEVTCRLAYKNPIGHSNMGIRRSALESVNGYNDELVSQFDYDLWVRLALAGYRLGAITSTLGIKRSHSGQSYERKGHLGYVLRSTQIQWRAVRGLKSNYLISGILVVARITWACLPVRGRLWVRRMGVFK